MTASLKRAAHWHIKFFDGGQRCECAIRWPVHRSIFEFLKRWLCKLLILLDFDFVFGFQMMKVPTYFSKNNVSVDVEKQVLG